MIVAWLAYALVLGTVGLLVIGAVAARYLVNRSIDRFREGRR